MSGKIRHGEAASGGYFTALAAVLFFVRAQRQITVVLEQHTVLYFLFRRLTNVRGSVSDEVHMDPAEVGNVHD